MVDLVSINKTERLRQPGWNDMPGKLRQIAADIEAGKLPELEAMLILMYPIGSMVQIGAPMRRFTVLGQLAQAVHDVAEE